MPKIVLKDFQESINSKFADYEIHLPSGEICLFTPAVRMPKEQRRKLGAVMNIKARAEVNDDSDIFDVYRDTFRVSEKVPGHFDKLQEVIGDDPAVWQELFIDFQELTQSGEASPSQTS